MNKCNELSACDHEGAVNEDKRVELSLVATTAPERIWLQVSDEAEDRDKPFPLPTEELTWSESSVVDCEVEYVRADLADTPSSAEPAAWTAEANISYDVRSIVKISTDEIEIDRFVHRVDMQRIGCNRKKISLYTRPPAVRELSDDEIADIGRQCKIQAFECAEFRKSRGQEMTAPEQREYDAQIAFVKGVISAARKS